MLKEDFYRKYNLNNYYLANLAHLGSKTVQKYWDGIPIRQSSKDRLESFIQFIIDNDLVRPSGVGIGYVRWKHRQLFLSVEQYEKYIQQNWNY